MRILLALIIALLLLAVSLDAEAGLVEDLRSGKSDVRAEHDVSPWTREAYRKYIRREKAKPDYKRFVTFSESG